jgi:hypothetical protein
MLCKCFRGSRLEPCRRTDKPICRRKDTLFETVLRPRTNRSKVPLSSVNSLTGVFVKGKGDIDFEGKDSNPGRIIRQNAAFYSVSPIITSHLRGHTARMFLTHVDTATTLATHHNRSPYLLYPACVFQSLSQHDASTFQQPTLIISLPSYCARISAPLHSLQR